MTTMILTVALTAMALPTVAGDHPVTSVRYVLATGLDVEGTPAEHGTVAVCISGGDLPGDGALSVGGVCTLTPQRTEDVRLTVADDSGMPVSFHWHAMNAEGKTCTEGNGTSEVVIDLPEDCPQLDVFLWAGATTGTITTS